MDQNWYSQDFSPKPPKPTSYLWVWLLLGFVAFLGLIVAAAFVVVRQVPPGKNFGEWIAESASRDDSQRLEFRKSAAVNRLVTASAAYAKNQLVSDDVTPEDLAQIQSLLTELVSIFADDDAFAAKTSLPEFRDKVRKAPSLSLTAMRQFQLEFDDWFTMYSPYGSSTSRIELVSVRRDTSANALIAYTWVFSSAYPERVAWYLRSNGHEMRIIDFEVLDTSALQSDESAREFSAAFTGQFWENYLAIHELNGDAATTVDDIAAARAELTRLSQLTFPKSIAHWAYYRLAMVARGLEDNDRCLQLLAKTEEVASIPGVYWQRASIFAELKDYPKATENLRKYTDMIGPGPECFQLEAEIAVAMKDYEKANLAWTNLLSMDPGTTSIPWNFHNHMSPTHAMAVAESIRSRPDSAIAAQKIATLFVERERGDLAEILMPLAESESEPTSGLLALRANIANFNGDNDGYLSNLEQAWNSAAHDDPARAAWLYSWASGLQSNGNGAEAISKSPNPGMTFYDLAWDEDGELMLNARELNVLSDALQNASASEAEAQKWLTVWKSLAPVTVDVQRHDHNAVWDSLSSLFAADAEPENKRIVELLEELELRWVIQDCLAESAVRSGHAVDAWDLLPEDNRIRTLLWHVDTSKDSGTVSQLADRLRQDNPDDIDLIYCDALIASLNEDYTTALQKYQEFLEHPDLAESSFQYRANNDVVSVAMKHTDWKSAVSAMPNDVLHSLVKRLEVGKRFEDAAAALELVRQRGTPLAETISVEASLLHEQQKWPALCQLCERWLEARRAEDPARIDNGYSSSTMGAKFIDAVLMTGQLELADEVVAQLPDAWYAGTWKLRIAVARNDQAAAEAIYNESAAGSLPDVSELGSTSAVYWSDAWKDFRRVHPMDFYDISPSASSSSNALILQSAPWPPNASDVQTALQSLEINVTVEDLTEQLQQLEQRAIAQLAKAPGDSNESARASSDARHLYRITADDMSFLMCTGSDAYHLPANGESNSSEAESLDDTELSAPLQKAIDNHRGWINLRAEFNSNRDADRVEVLHAKIIAALLKNGASVVCVGSVATLVAPDVIAALEAGTTSTLPNAESYSPIATEPLMAQLDKHSSTRLRALRKRLADMPPGAPAPAIKLLLNTPGAWQRDRLMMECPLLEWEPQAFPTQFTVSLGDSPLVAPTFREERAVVMNWSVLDWREE